MRSAKYKGNNSVSMMVSHNGHAIHPGGQRKCGDQAKYVLCMREVVSTQDRPRL